MTVITSLRDLSDQENVRQAEHELHRAGSEPVLAAWARRWGEACLARLREIVGDQIDADDFEEAETAANAAEEKFEALSRAAETLVKVLDDDAAEHSAKLEAAVSALENAL